MNKKWIAPAAGVLIIGAASVLFAKGFLHIEKTNADVSVGQTLLAEMEEQNIESVQASIQSVQAAREEARRQQQEAEEAALKAQHEAEEAAQAAADAAAQQAYFEQWCADADAMAEADAFKPIFANSVVIGDSIAYGILQTDMMLESSVVSEVGGNVHDLMDYIPQVQSLSPSNIFLYVGFNDIGMCAGDTEKYYNDIVSFVTQLQAACPGVPIYFNQLVPPISLEYLGHEEYGDTPTYDAILQQVASEYGCYFIETNDLIEQEFYYKDGYHMIRPFYPRWLRRMAETAGLM